MQISWRGFWQALKGNLRILSIDTDQMVDFPCKISDLGSGILMRLEQISMKGQVVWGEIEEDFLGWIESFERIKEIALDKVMITDEKRLKMLLNDVKKIKEGLTLKLNINVKELDEDIFLRILEEIIDEKKIEGHLEIRFYGAIITDDLRMKRILEKVAENETFGRFEI